MRWQKRARLGIAIFGIAFAVVVYFAIGERGKVTPPAAPQRVDPNATIETSRGVINRITGTKQDFTITFDQQLGYENNAQKFRGVRIEVKERQGRDFVITSGEAQAGEQQQNLQLTKNVRMEASDGFVLSTQLATFNQTEGIVRTPGPVSFSKGGMTGTGVGMAYDKNTDVLTVLEQSNVRMVDGQGRTTGEFSASKATLARLQNYLDLEGAVHATRGAQTIDADRARANLTEDEKTITAIELRGNARVAGGSTAFESMSGGDIDLDYADDGQTIERVALTGSAAIALKGNPGGPSTPLGAGRQMRGNLLTLTLAPDGAVTSAVGRSNVELHLPASNGSAARHVKAEMLDAVGEPGKGMTSARFTNAVEYLEESTAGEPPRKVTSRALTVALDGDVVTSALFTGRVQFEEKDFKASAAEARYEPARGVLRLKNADQGTASAAAAERRPQVADEQIAVEADTIDVTFEGRKMLAAGAVKTVLQGKSKTPALLKQGQPTNVSAASLEYTGDPAFARYSGGAQLWQGDTAIRGEGIAIDQDKGNLTALGGARSTLTLGDATSIGRGEEIRYEDATRQLTYVGKPPPVGAVSKAATPPPAADPATGALAQLSGPQGDLTAQRIVVHLARAESKMERLEASTNITLRLDTRVSTGGSLEYFTADERYVLSGSAAVPVKVVETCRETTGKTLTFFKSTDRIIVDGNEEIRTRTTSGGPCPDAR